MELSWLIIIILAYFFFSLSSLGDKLVLSGKPDPASYTFFVGLSGLTVVFFLPFTVFAFPPLHIFILILLEAAFFTSSLYLMYSALKKYEVSKVATTLGAAQPIFIFVLSWALWGPQMLDASNIIAFLLLVTGTLIISIGKNTKSTSAYLLTALFASLLFSADYILTKLIFMSQPFLLGLFWMRATAAAMVLIFLLAKSNRTKFFARKNFLNKKTGSLFVFTNISGGIGNLLQSFAISLAPIAFLPILNSLRGIQYIFVFGLTLFFSFFLPRILKEKISSKILFQKIISIALIAGGLALIAF